jgi:predicted dehydrogenase
MDRLKIGVIGCGGFGRRRHVGNYVKIPEAEVVAVADLNAERAREAAAEHGVPHPYSDYREMLDRHTLDIVSLGTMTFANRDAAVAALEAGVNVLVSKPMALNLAQAQEMVEAAERAGKLLIVGMQNRFISDVRALHDFLAEGKLGHVYHSRIWHGHVMGIPDHGGFHTRAKSGGGPLFHTTVHTLDSTLWMLGFPKPVRVSAMSYQKMSKMKEPIITWQGGLEAYDIEDFNTGLVHFADGSTMSVTSNWLAHPRQQPKQREGGVEILGDWGVAYQSPLCIELEDGKDLIDVTPELPPTPEDPFLSALEEFCHAVLEGRPPLVRPGEMLDVQRIMDALYASAERGEEVSVTD